MGTINLDYRSLYHHFECATYLYKTDCISAKEKDFQDTLAKCRQVTEKTIREEKESVIPQKVIEAIEMENGYEN